MAESQKEAGQREDSRGPRSTPLKLHHPARLLGLTYSTQSRARVPDLSGTPHHLPMTTHSAPCLLWGTEAAGRWAAKKELVPAAFASLECLAGHRSCWPWVWAIREADKALPGLLASGSSKEMALPASIIEPV